MLFITKLVIKCGKSVKTQQISSEAKRTFLKEKKALKTTTFVIGIVLLCYMPRILYSIVLGSLATSSVEVVLTTVTL